MIGRGRAHGAVTVVNAIPTGRGAAIGIELGTEARAELQEGDGPVQVVIAGSPDEDPSLARACLAVVSEHVGTALHGSLTTESELPIARGLKSSSVAANALVLACLDALEEPADPDTVLALSVAAARRAGVTVTGALDDAAASLLGGLVVTDNARDRVLERKPLQSDRVVLLLVPSAKRYTATAAGPLASLGDLAHRCLDHVQADQWQRALTLNGLGVAAALGQDTGPTHRALLAGAEAAGTTGTGPAVAAVLDRDDAPAVRRAWEPYDAQVLGTRPTDEGLTGVGA